MPLHTCCFSISCTPIQRVFALQRCKKETLSSSLVSRGAITHCHQVIGSPTLKAPADRQYPGAQHKSKLGARVEATAPPGSGVMDRRCRGTYRPAVARLGGTTARGAGPVDRITGLYGRLSGTAQSESRNLHCGCLVPGHRQTAQFAVVPTLCQGLRTMWPQGQRWDVLQGSTLTNSVAA